MREIVELFFAHMFDGPCQYAFAVFAFPSLTDIGLFFASLIIATQQDVDAGLVELGAILALG
ncbi:hypothetical protein [Arcanobacterium pinnipediorum]|uniref:SNARE associated Golgi protein n=1 Tax=Arcanobacterium pinnipediorum TaxID=1503041 RepID=A0ABY5AI56_9ACTO|nr:hypothetical protein [Arcanobacterium pinnipediorum]USR79892.1 hypothetical protein NG665_02600 [Arcanobacterium pinnipediorum]